MAEPKLSCPTAARSRRRSAAQPRHALVSVTKAWQGALWCEIRVDKVQLPSQKSNCPLCDTIEFRVSVQGPLEYNGVTKRRVLNSALFKTLCTQHLMHFNTTDKGKNPRSNRRSSWQPTPGIAPPLGPPAMAFALLHKAPAPAKPQRPLRRGAPTEWIGSYTVRQWLLLRSELADHTNPSRAGGLLPTLRAARA